MKCKIIEVKIKSLNYFFLADDDNTFGDDRYTMRSQCLDALQKQIDQELYASLTYLNMVSLDIK